MAVSNNNFRSDMERNAWHKVAKLVEFHWSDLVKAGFAPSTAKNFAARWLKNGRAVMVRKDMHRKILRNANLDVEPVEDAAPEFQRSAEANMWRAMRGLRGFTAKEVAAHANVGGIAVTVDQAHGYCRTLLNAGYLRVVQTAVPGQRAAAYRLINNSGPNPPVRKRVWGIYDPNNDEFCPNTGEGSH